MILDKKLEKLSNTIFRQIKKKVLSKKKINILVTGGRNALKLYFFLNKKIKILDLRKVFFWLTDERLNYKHKKESNYFSIKKVLFKKINENDYNCLNILSNSNDLKDSINKYEIFFPKKIDLMIITLGDDGHVASLFPRANEESISKNFIKVYVKNNKYKHRVSIKKKLFNKTNKIYALCFGKKKKNIYNKLIKSHFKTNLPADYLKHATFCY